MEVSVLRLLKAFFDDPNDGLNAILEIVPRWPADPAPPSVLIAEESSEGWAARRRFPSEKLRESAMLAIVISDEIDFPDEDREANPTGQVRSATVPIAFIYADRLTESELGTRNWYYTARAIREVLSKLFLPDLADRRLSLETRVQLTQLEGMTTGLVEPMPGESVVRNGLVARISAEERVASYTP